MSTTSLKPDNSKMTKAPKTGLSLTVTKDALSRALGHVLAVVEKRNTIPILSNVLITAKDGIVTTTATDMEMAVTDQVPDTVVTRDGACTAPAATLFDIVRKLPDGSQIKLDHAGGDSALVLSSGKYKTSIQALPAEDYPSMTDGQMPHRFTLVSSDLKEMIDGVRFAISTEETRFYLNGTYMHVTTNDEQVQVLRLVATDGHRLARHETTLPEGAGSIPGVIIPRKTVAEILKLCGETSGAVEIALSDTKISFTFGTVRFVSKLIDGQFPEYSRVIPKANDRILRVSKNDLVQAADRVAAISSERTRPIKLSIGKQDGKASLTLTTNDSTNGQATETIEDGVFFDSMAMEIGFQARYVRDVADRITTTLEMRLGADGSSPAVIVDPDKPQGLFVLMPMRVA